MRHLRRRQLKQLVGRITIRRSMVIIRLQIVESMKRLVWSSKEDVQISCVESYS